MSSLISHALYGGHMTITLPSRFQCISEMINAPNHQEIFSDSDTDQSFIIEINQMMTPNSSEIAEAQTAMRKIRNDEVHESKETEEQKKDGLLSTSHEWRQCDLTSDLAGDDLRRAFLIHVQELLNQNQARDLHVFNYHRFANNSLPAIEGCDAAASCVLEMKASKGRQNEAGTENTILIYFILVRLKAHETDLCFILNAPQHFAKTSISHGRPIVSREETMQVLQTALTSFKIKNYAFLHAE